MAIRSEHRGKARLAHIVAVVVFALAQLAVAAHAEDDHDAHASTTSCAICCLSFFDDDVDALPPIIDSVAPSQRLDFSLPMSVAQIPVAKFDLHSIARGPPHN
ncbi:MAG: hypothetical protein AAF936_07385 [Pseudomonadota bacterium]